MIFGDFLGFLYKDLEKKWFLFFDGDVERYFSLLVVFICIFFKWFKNKDEN